MTYGERKKRNGTDYYGTWHEGRQTQPDIIAGYTRQWKMLGHTVTMRGGEPTYLGKPRP